ncbi:MAG: flippase-like domain-containing protein [Anaerolineae bacterium]|nr:flippase-like domain-containing protein [Anaerolineae bacterium]
MWLTLRDLDLQAAWAVLLEARLWWLLVSVASVVLVAIVKAARWWYLYPQQYRTVSWVGSFAVLMTSQMVNLLIPIRLGELIRIGLMLRAKIPAATTLSTIALEKSLDLLSVGLLVAFAVPSAVLPHWFPSSTGLVAGVGGGLLIVALLMVWIGRAWIIDVTRQIFSFRNWLPIRWQDRLMAGVTAMLDGLGALADFRTSLPVLTLTALSWVASVLTMVAMLAAFRLPSRWYIGFVLSLALYLSNMVPTPPALVGVVGAVTIMTLGWFGISGERSAAAGVALNVVLVVPVVLMGAWATWHRFLNQSHGTLRERWVSSLGIVTED